MRGAWLALALMLAAIPVVGQEDATEVGVCSERDFVQNLMTYYCATGSSISCGSFRSGTLDTNDCVRHDWGELYYWDAWYFAGTAGQTVTITISSAEFDPAAGLFDPSGNYAAESDNLAGVEAASGSHQLRYRLPVSGNWMILATSALSVGLGEYDHIPVLGRYSLSLSCANLGLPNLVPYKPSSWSDKIVVSTVQGGTTDVSPLWPTDRLYISWAMANVGPTDPDAGSVPDGAIVSDLYIDGVRSYSGYCSSCAEGVPPAGMYVGWSRSTPITLSAGAHQLKLVVDPSNFVPEGDETDNEYVKTFVISAPLIQRMPVIHSVPRRRSP